VVFAGKSWNSFPRKPRLIAARREATPPRFFFGGKLQKGWRVGFVLT